MVQPVILCGGSGTRLWPLSRTSYPKQFVEISGGHVLFEETLKRCQILDGAEPIVVSNSEYRFLTAEHMRKCGVKGRLVLEPCKRNTAPAIAAAAFMTSEEDPVLLVMPADHHIGKQDVFAQAVRLGYERAQQNKFICFGIIPNHPHTGYGYINRGEQVCDNVFTVNRFVEKPELSVAEEYVASGDYFWNSGIFMFKASVYLKALKELEPEMYQCTEKAVADCYEDLDFIRLQEDDFIRCPAKSVDYAVMERVSNIEVIPFDIDWRDLGSWESLHEIHEHDADGNSLLGDVVAEDCLNCYVRSSERMVVTLGLENTSVIETADAVFVAPFAKLDCLKKVVNRLKASNRIETEFHKIIYRPWGSFESLSMDHRFQVKRIIVKAGEILSLQMHYNRAEHWVVVHGTAKVVNEDKEFLLKEEESVYIPTGNLHRLENPGKIPLEIIEVQIGSYLGEDDIVRFEDKYKR